MKSSSDDRLIVVFDENRYERAILRRGAWASPSQAPFMGNVISDYTRRLRSVGAELRARGLRWTGQGWTR